MASVDILERSISISHINVPTIPGDDGYTAIHLVYELGTCILYVNLVICAVVLFVTIIRKDREPADEDPRIEEKPRIDSRLS